MKRFLAVVLAVFLSLATAAFALPKRAEIPPLPVGWELQIIPGFEPCIELALESAYRPHSDGRTTDEMKANMSKWGEAAVEELICLYEDPRWREYRTVIAGHLGAMPTERSRTWANGYAYALLKKPEWTERDCGAFRMLVTAFSKDFGDATFALALERLPEFAGLVDAEEHGPTAFDEVCRLFECAEREGLADILEAHAMSGDEETREVCIKRLVYHRPASAVREALRLGDETRDNRRRRGVLTVLSYHGDRIRAQEQMHHVLEAEAR